MSVLGRFIENDTPKFNKELVEGLCYHRLKKAINYIDNCVNYNCSNKTNTHLKYLGYRVLTPKEELKLLLKSSKTTIDIAENNIYPVEFVFHYGSEKEDRKYVIYLPYLNKGNLMKLSGNNFLISPVLADKVISIGEKVIFINIMTAKYNFERNIYSVKVNNVYQRVPIIITKLYKNQSKKLENTTEAIPTVMHYLLAAYGYNDLMMNLLGFIPKPVYSTDDIDDSYTVISSTEVKPRSYIVKNIYESTKIKFIVKNEQYTEEVAYVLGNIYYIIDNFPEFITIDIFNNIFIWKKLLGEIIHSGKHQLNYIMEKIDAHFKDLGSSFDNVTIQKLSDIGVTSNNLLELLIIIFKKFNDWILSTEVKSLYNNKAFECELYVLSRITSNITRAVLDISKEELRIEGQELEPKIVSKILDRYIKPKMIFGVKKDILYVSSVNYSGDHLYPKNTAIVVEQESDPINTITNTSNAVEKKKIIGSMITIGSILALPKKNPTPLVRLNPYVTTDPINGTVLPHPLYNEIINTTSKLLNNIVLADIESPDEFTGTNEREELESEFNDDDNFNDGEEDFTIDD